MKNTLVFGKCQIIVKRLKELYMKNRFDLENDITALYGSADDLKTVCEMMYDSNFIYDADRTFNVLFGLAEVLEAKIGKLENTFAQVFELNQYSPPEIKERREAIFSSPLDAKPTLEKETENKWDDFFDALDRP
jgi:hypothetical protein